MKNEISNDFYAVNGIVLILGLPTIWLVLFIFSEEFVWADAIRGWLLAFVLVNVPLLWKLKKNKM